MNKERILDCLREDYRVFSELGYKVLGVFLYGSQNQNCSWEESDIDTVLVYTSCVEKVPLSRYDHLTEKGLVMPLSIEEFLYSLEEGGRNEYESLFTEYCYIAPQYRFLWSMLRAEGNELAKERMWKILESHLLVLEIEQKLLIDRMGEENRHLSRFVYVFGVLENLLLGQTYQEAIKLKSPYQELVIRLKRETVFSREECLEMAISYYDKITEMIHTYTQLHFRDYQSNKTLRKIYQLCKLFVSEEGRNGTKL